MSRTQPVGAALGWVVFGMLCWVSTAARANGRLPGATGLAIHPTDERQLLLGLSYGLALTRDAGASWSWMCEQQIEGNGSDVDPSMVVTGDGSLVVLSLTNGGVLVSRNDGCSFERALGPLQGHRGADLTLDPNQPGRVLGLMSTITGVNEASRPIYRNFLAHTLDHGQSWAQLAELPSDLAAEAVELAPSDSRRIYVSGTSSDNPLQGIVERSDDAGLTWKRTTVDLPRGSGSLFISGIHPSDPDRLWFRVPGRGDLLGVDPARLWLSADGARSFQPLARTEAGMLGFAVSPDGTQIAFGGPRDGVLVAPADASAAPLKVADLRVSCLRWNASGLYVCAGEPVDPYSLGFAADPLQGFVPLWQRANTCRGACAAPSTLEQKCSEPWQMIAPLLAAEHALCEASATLPAVGSDAGSAVFPVSPEAGVSPVGAASPTKGCTVASRAGHSAPRWLVALVSILGWRLGSRGLRRERAQRLT